VLVTNYYRVLNVEHVHGCIYCFLSAFSKCLRSVYNFLAGWAALSR